MIKLLKTKNKKEKNCKSSKRALPIGEYQLEWEWIHWKSWERSQKEVLHIFWVLKEENYQPQIMSRLSFRNEEEIKIFSDEEKMHANLIRLFSLRPPLTFRGFSDSGMWVELIFLKRFLRFTLRNYYVALRGLRTQSFYQTLPISPFPTVIIT